LIEARSDPRRTGMWHKNDGTAQEDALPLIIHRAGHDKMHI